MTLPDADMIATYTSNTENFDTTSDVKANSGTISRATEDEPIIIEADDGVVVPSRTTVEIDGIADPQAGAIIHDSTLDLFKLYFKSAWQILIRTASNVGGKSEVFKQKTLDDLEFRTIESTDDSITITQNTDTLDLVVTGSEVGIIISTPFTVTSEDILLVDPGDPASNIEIKLPASADRYDALTDRVKPLVIKNIHDANDFVVNITPDGVEEIDGKTTLQLCAGQSATLTPDGSNWSITSGYGADYQFIESLNAVITSQDFATLPVTKFDEPLDLCAGTYEVKLSFEGSGTAINRRITVALYIDNVLVDIAYNKEPKDTNDHFYVTKVLPVVFTQGSHDFRVDFGKSGGASASSVTLENVRLIVEKKL